MMKKGILFIIISLLFLIINVDALSVNKDKIELVKSSNDSIDLYANLESSVNEVDFTLVYTSYDIPAYFKVNDNYKLTTEGVKNKVKFNDYMQGKIKIGTIQVRVVDNPKVDGAEVNVSSAYGIDQNGNKIKLNPLSIKVKVVSTTVDTEEEPTFQEPSKTPDEHNNLLKGINSKLVNITLQEGVYEYEVNISEEIEELDLEAVAYDKEAKIEISTQKIAELTNNEIKIKVDLNNEHQEYIIKVKQKVKEEIKIDDSEIEVDKSYKVKWIVLAILLAAMLAGLIVLGKKFHL